MDSFKNIRRILTISLAGALMISTVSHPVSRGIDAQSFLFPQFLSAAAASHEDRDDDKKEPEITYAFGFLELLKALH